LVLRVVDGIWQRYGDRRAQEAKYPNSAVQKLHTEPIFQAREVGSLDADLGGDILLAQTTSRSGLSDRQAEVVARPNDDLPPHGVTPRVETVQISARRFDVECCADNSTIAFATALCGYLHAV
jgi:hypothetical protein